MNRNLIYKLAFGAFGATLVIAIVVPPCLAKSKNIPQPQRDRTARINSGQKRIYALLNQGNIAAAEMETNTLALEAPNTPAVDFIRAEICLKKGRFEDAQALYHKLIFKTAGNVGSPQLLLSFAALSEKTGRLEDARLSYGKVARTYASGLDEILVDTLSTKITLTEVRAIATALDCLENHPIGYQNAIRTAVKQAPNQPITHFVYARLLNAFERRFSANAELDKAAELLPPSIAKDWKDKRYHDFQFDMWDHESGGTIAKGGKVSFRTFKIALTDSKKPMYESDTKLPPSSNP